MRAVMGCVAGLRRKEGATWLDRACAFAIVYVVCKDVVKVGLVGS